MDDIKALIGKMTLEEKAGLCSGSDFWHTKAVGRLSVPAVMVSDGPHGLRKQEEGADHLGIHDSIKAVCFPAACATACSFDRTLLYEMGSALGKECRAEGVAVLLGPAVNIKRSPLCGRNFEYFSEDPFLAGELACAFVQGVQGEGAGVSVKHFAANNQETRRMSVSSEVSERALREIYFPAFEKVVKDAKPATVMCSYNKLNGVYASENEWLLTDVLRKEWGFGGFVVSDWYAVSDRVKGLKAGLDLEMPGGDEENDKKIVAAVKSGELPEEVLDEAVERILRVILPLSKERTAPFDREKDHEKAVSIAAECAVLLKNEGALPLALGEDVLFVGEFAERPRFQGGGSSHINAWRADGALAFAQGVRYVRGFGTDGEGTEEELKEALAAAERAKTVVVFAGLPDRCESEGYDRTHMRLPEAENRLIDALCEAGQKVVVVLHNGSPVGMPWIGRVNAVLEMYLAGEGSGEACIRLLTGEVNPSGKLAESFPLRLEDTPSYLNFPGDRERVKYAEDIFVGYRYYDSKKEEVLFPFGHGLSYTTFAYSDLRLSSEEWHEGERLKVTLTVTNTGTRAGKEVVELYISDQSGEAVRPLHELKGFEKIFLAPGESKKVTFELGGRAFAFFDEKTHGWRVPNGKFVVEAGASSRDLRLFAEVMVHGRAAAFRVDDDTTVEQLFAHPATRAVMQGLLKKFRPGSSDDKMGDTDREMMRAAYLQAPLRTVRLALNMTKEQYEGLLNALNGAFEG